MHAMPLKILIPAVLVMLLTAGCGSRDDRLVRLATDNAHQQAEQNRQMAELQKEVATGTRTLVEADAQSREALIRLQHDLQTAQAEIGHARDRLEAERREIAAQRRTDPVIAAAITDIGLVLAALLPLVICWCLLRQRADADADQAVCELLVEELAAREPLLLPNSAPRHLGCQADPQPGGPPADSSLIRT